ncbi:MHYT domain-containing protein [Paraburkholderia bannensis]|uniref:MHYT domain-containing protein n=1 Tax=Paraburkholderia bannensis TaxID=765414 RepID=UPI002ABD77CF|nr:MHYT domain-containing protein [Paraburkholderia bannensis]
MTGYYDPSLVVLSCLLAIFASFTALDISDRLDVIGKRPLLPWIAFGGCIMGLGIWSMHFIAMLAFHLPIAVGYNIPVTLLSLLIAIVASAIGFLPLCRYELRWSHLAGAAVAMGLGVAGMHYLGMWAMDICPAIHYQTWLVVLSVVIAILASGAALLLAFDLRRRSALRRTRQISSAVVMGVAVCGMHYCGMAAAHFEAGSYSVSDLRNMPVPWLAGIVITFSLLIFGASIAIAMLDARSSAKARAMADAILDEHMSRRGATR